MNRVSQFDGKSSGSTFSKVAVALLWLLSMTCLAEFSAVAVRAQSYSQLKSISGPGLKVVSIQEELDKRTIYLHLAEAVTVGRPHFNYLPGERGETVLIADFDGLTLTQSQSRNISLVDRSNSQVRGNSSDNRFRNPSYTKFPGVKSVHIALAQVSPPKLRISFTADDPAVLKTVSVGAAPSVLKVSWGEPSALNTSSSNASSNSISASAHRTTSKTSDENLLPAQAEPRPAPAPKINKSFDKTQNKRSQGQSLSAGSAGKLSSSKLSTGKDSAGESEPPLAPPIKPNKKELSEKPSRGWFSRLKERTLDIIGLSDERSQIESEPDDKMKESTEAGQAQSKQPQLVEKEGSTGTAAVERAAPEPVEDLGPPPLITLDKVDDTGKGSLEIFRVELPNRKDLEYKSFRLQGPDRYVMDIKDMRSIVNAALPDAAASPLVRSIRVGVPNAEASTGRLVLELEDGVTVDELFNQGSSYMTITLSKGLSQKNSSLSLGQAIVVPRAPSETVIVLDAGHGGSDPGAQRSDVNEKDVTLAITAKLKKVLETKGARIVMTRSDDTFVSLEDRVKITNQVNPNLFLSVHINSLQSTSDIHGIETYYQTDRSLPLAKRVHESLVTGLAAPDRSVRRARFYVINHTPVPAILAEVGYITNKTERDRLISSDYQNKIANALARGVMLYLQDVNKGSEELAGKQTSQIAASGNSRSAK